MIKIISAAILLQGKAYTGKSHAQIIRDMVNIYRIKPPITGVQGFMDSVGNFFNREESAKIALRAGQIDKLRYSKTKLFSEDLNYDKMIQNIRERRSEVAYS